MNSPLQLLAISGSLRAASSNGALLQAATSLAPAGVATASVEVPLGSNKVDVAALLADAEISASLRAGVANLVNEIRARA